MKVLNAAQLHMVKSLKITLQIQLSLHPCDSVFLNNRNMTANKVEKHCFVALNVKLLHEKLDSKCFTAFTNFDTAFALSNTVPPTRFNLFDIFAYTCKKRIIYLPELNYKSSRIFKAGEIKVGLSPSKKNFLFASMIALQK